MFVTMFVTVFVTVNSLVYCKTKPNRLKWKELKLKMTFVPKQQMQPCGNTTTNLHNNNSNNNTNFTMLPELQPHVKPHLLNVARLAVYATLS